MCCGKDAKSIIDRNTIESNDGPGISQDCLTEITNNEIKFNECGIEVENADPNIRDNKIFNNFGDGIIMKAEDEYPCKGMIH